MDMRRGKNILDLRALNKSRRGAKQDSYFRSVSIHNKDDQTSYTNNPGSAIKAPKIKFHILKGIVDDFIFSVKRLFDFKKDKYTLNLAPVEEKDNIIFYIVSQAARYLFIIVYYIFKVVKGIVFFPIVLLDNILDFIAKLIYILIKYILSFIVFILKKVFYFLRELISILDIQVPYFWYKKLFVFAVFSFILIIPIKMYYLKDTVNKVRGEVLGISIKALSYTNILSYVDDYLPVLNIAKYFAGIPDKRNILLIFQNNAELRPTGGFLGSYAYLSVKNAEILDLDIPGGGFYDLKGYVSRKIEAPLPFHIFSPYWQVWNANWFADFPLSAEKIIKLYEISGGETVDGIIAITPDVVEDILSLTGPIEVKDGLTIDRNNFRTLTQTEVEINYDKEENRPKEFIKDLFVKVAERLISQLDEKQGKKKEEYIKNLLYIIDKNLKEKNILVYASDSDIEKEIIDIGWGGELKDVPYGNYLSVVHTNIGGGKSDLVIQNKIRHIMRVQDQKIISEVYLTRTHNGKEGELFYGTNNLDYIRFYTPLGSKLIEASGFLSDDISDRFEYIEGINLKKDEDLEYSMKTASMDAKSKTEIYEESGKTVFANWLSLKPGQSKTVYLKYETPLGQGEDLMVFYWQKQAGDMNTYIESEIYLEDSVNKSSVFGDNVLINGNKIIYSNDLRQDRYVFISLK